MVRNGAMSVCNWWCEADYNGGNNQGRHCAPGDMASLCGGCSFCGTSSPTPAPTPSTTLNPTPAPTPSTTSNPTPAPSPNPTPSPPGECRGWCVSDYSGGRNVG